MALSPAARTEDISSLVKILNTETQAYSDSLSRCGVDPPSLKCPQMAPSEGKATAGPEIEKSKQAIVHACEKIVALIRGPAMWLSLEMGGMATTTSISLAIELQLHKLMSSDPDRPTHLSVLAKETGASPKLLKRVLRCLTQRFIFEEVAPSQYIHNAVSKMLTVSHMESYATLSADDLTRASLALPELLKQNKYQIPENSKQSAFSRAYSSDLNVYDYYRQCNPEHGRLFDLAMTGRPNGPYELYPYESLSAGSRLVDVGGGSGHVSARIARKHRQLRYIVQDSEETTSYGKSVYGPEGLPLEFQVRNFFSEQSEKGAEIYLLRHVLVDHPDPAASQILGCIADAMDADSRILVEDVVLPDTIGEDSMRIHNVIDFHLLTLLNSKERTIDDWKDLIASTGKNLEIENIWRGEDAECLLEIRRRF